MWRILIIVLLATRVCGAPPACSGQTLSGRGSGNKSAALGYVLLGSALALGSTAALCEIKSDREYSLYLETANPLEIRSHCDRAERYRNLSNVAMVGAEACALGLVVYLVRERHKEEPAPNRVRITMAMSLERVEVGLRW